jgi:hypothetical protein
MSKPKTTAQNLESRFAAGEDMLDYFDTAKSGTMVDRAPRGYHKYRLQTRRCGNTALPKERRRSAAKTQPMENGARTVPQCGIRAKAPMRQENLCGVVRQLKSVR